MQVPFGRDESPVLTRANRDLSLAYAWLDLDDEDVVLDVGCGDGHSLEHLTRFRTYYGFDDDRLALALLHDKYRGGNVRTVNRMPTRSDVLAIAPTKGLVVGRLHQLSDAMARELLDALAASSRLERFVSIDPVLRPGHPVDNVLARLDRGRFVRTVDAYRSLIEASPFGVERAAQIRLRTGVAHYWVTTLAARRRAA